MQKTVGWQQGADREPLRLAIGGATYAAVAHDNVGRIQSTSQHLPPQARVMRSNSVKRYAQVRGTALRAYITAQHLCAAARVTAVERPWLFAEASATPRAALIVRTGLLVF